MKVELIHSVGRGQVIALNELKNAIAAAGLPVTVEVRRGHDDLTGGRLLVRVQQKQAGAGFRGVHNNPGELIALVDRVREVITSKWTEISAVS